MSPRQLWLAGRLLVAGTVGLIGLAVAIFYPGPLGWAGVLAVTIYMTLRLTVGALNDYNRKGQ